MLITIVAVCLALGAATPAEDPPAWRFEAPVRLLADGEAVRVESPGWACPAWFDVDGDGHEDLLVGQFSGGKIRVYRNKGDGALAAGRWLQADGAVAKVPGVW